jgi:HPt (histidine-containing phosphotransfer) domain-containing protein
MTATDPIVVAVERDLRDVVHLYLESRGADLARLDLAGDSGDFEEVRRIGHKLHGSSGGLGFAEAGNIGAALEDAARAKDAAAVAAGIARLREYFARVSIRYV